MDYKKRSFNFGIILASALTLGTCVGLLNLEDRIMNISESSEIRIAENETTDDSKSKELSLPELTAKSKRFNFLALLRQGRIVERELYNSDHPLETLIIEHTAKKRMKKTKRMERIGINGSKELEILKSERILRVYMDGELIKEYQIALGYNPIGDKVREGDYRTPEGTFYLTRRSRDPNWAYSLKISYPAPEDAKRGLESGLINKTQYDVIVQAEKVCQKPLGGTRLGGGILIHGGGNAEDWTLGCVALNDNDAEELYHFAQVGCYRIGDKKIPRTKVIIRP